MIANLACGTMLLLAMWWDIRTHHIPNALTLIGLTVGIVIANLPGGLGWQKAVFGTLAGLLAFMPLYLFRLLGAGDVKLLAALGAYLGIPGIFEVALLSGLAGGLLALSIALFHGELKETIGLMGKTLANLPWQFTSSSSTFEPITVTSSHKLPYAIAISIGTLGYWMLKH